MKNENKQHLDLAFLEEFCENDHRKMAQYIQSFLETAPEDFRLIKEAADQKQWVQVKSIAHSLKPQVKLIGLPVLQLILEKIETQVTQTDNSESVQSLISELEESSEKAIDLLIQTLVSLS